jgi:hypothetical protein
MSKAKDGALVFAYLSAAKALHDEAFARLISSIDLRCSTYPPDHKKTIAIVAKIHTASEILLSRLDEFAADTEGALDTKSAWPPRTNP